MLEFFKNAIFPINCIECNNVGAYLCKSCIKKQKSKIQYIKKATEIDFVVAFFNYSNSAITALIKKLKYKYETDALLVLEIIINKIIRENKELFLQFRESTIMPVPLTNRKMRARNFNQSELIAKCIAEQLKLEYSNNLIKTKNTPNQADLSATRRKTNLNNIFKYLETKKAPAKVLLIDDVVTTAATLNECAKVLKSNGTQKVFGLTLCHG